MSNKIPLTLTEEQHRDLVLNLLIDIHATLLAVTDHIIYGDTKRDELLGTVEQDENVERSIDLLCKDIESRRQRVLAHILHNYIDIDTQKFFPSEGDNTSGEKQ